MSEPSRFDRFLARQLRYGRLHLKITVIGWWYLGFTIAVGAAGLNTGNNLLFLLFGLLLSGIIISGVLSNWTLRGLTVTRQLPEDATVGRPVLVGLRITNRKKRMASYAVAVRDLSRVGVAGRAFALTLTPGETRELSYRAQPARRGRVDYVRVDLVTRFPFGIFEKWMETDAKAEGIVFPAEVPVRHVESTKHARAGERPTATAGQGSEFFALRDQRAGDDARGIHWLTSARRGRPVVVERERERRRRITVVLDNRASTLREQANGRTVDDLLDCLVEVAAALVRQAEHDNCEVALGLSGEFVIPGAGPLHLKRVLTALALVAPSEDGPPPEVAADSDVLTACLDHIPSPMNAPGEAKAA